MRLQAALRLAANATLDLLFPLRCLGCGVEGTMLCPSCAGALPRIEPPYCDHCGSPLSQDGLCRSCTIHRPTIDGIRSLFTFEGTVRKAVHGLKYGGLKSAASPLAGLLGQFLDRNPIPADVIVPVPLHKKRLRSRGYNQSSLLAGPVAENAGLPVREHLLVRKRDTVSQAKTSSAAERRRNVQGAFIAPHSLDGDRVLLIDDVCTTGATMDACATALMAAGARNVWGLTLAREAFLQGSRYTLENRQTVIIK
jgi:ComF family protein